MLSVERLQKIELYGQGYELLNTCLQAIPRSIWQFKPGLHDWSIHEVIVHIADSEINAALRARLLAVEPGRILMAYNQEAWADQLNYHQQDIDEALQLTRYARLTTYRWLKTLSNEIFSHTIIHPEYDEPYSFDRWLAIYSAHIPDHIEQIRNNYALWQKTVR